MLKTEHFDIYYYPEMRELAEMGAAWAEESYDELENRFEHSLSGRTPIVFYASNIHFKQTNITPGFIPDGVGGFFEFLKGRVVIPANGGLTRFRRVIRHELVHVFTYSKLLRSYIDHRVPPDRFVPLWYTEGLAEYWSGDPDFQHDMMLRDALASNFLAEMPDLDRIAGSYLMYKEGEAICRFIAETYGDEMLLAFIENSWRDQDFREVMAYTLQTPFAEVADQWLVWLKEQYYPAFESDDIASVIVDRRVERGLQRQAGRFYRRGRAAPRRLRQQQGELHRFASRPRRQRVHADEQARAAVKGRAVGSVRGVSPPGEPDGRVVSRATGVRDQGRAPRTRCT